MFFVIHKFNSKFDIHLNHLTLWKNTEVKMSKGAGDLKQSPYILCLAVTNSLVASVSISA